MSRSPRHQGRRRYWTRERLIEAGQRWIARYGEPPKLDQWNQASFEHPHRVTATEVFGSWSAYIVALGAEPRPSGQQPLWTPELCLDAIRAFHAENGRVPKAKDFENGPRWRYPCPNTVLKLCGSWRQAVRKAGLRPVRRYDSRWNKDTIAEAMLLHVLRNGKWPTCSEWDYVDEARERPSKSTVLYHFKSWNAAKLYAGWNGEAPIEYVEPRCSECGTELENCVIGCHTCTERFRARRRRAEVQQAETAATSDKGTATVSDQRRVAA